MVEGLQGPRTGPAATEPYPGPPTDRAARAFNRPSRGARPALHSFRGSGTLLGRFSQLLVDFLEIQEIDINPLLATPERIIALDARVLLCPLDLPRENGRPWPFILIPTSTRPLRLPDAAKC